MKRIFSICFALLILAIIPDAVNSTASGIAVTGTVTEEGTGAPVSDATVMFISESSDTVRTATDAVGKYFVLLNEIITSVDNAVHPEAVVLRQNYPNPFNPTTTIEYELRSPGRAQLAIFNSMGQKVRTLADGYHERGLHRIVWNGRDDRGRGAAAGVYIYQLKTGGQSLFRKMLLLDGGGSGEFATPIISITRKSTKYCANTIHMLVSKDWFSSFEQNIEVSGDTTELHRDCVLSPVDFFPLASGNEWRFRKIAPQTQTVLSETTAQRIQNAVTVDGKLYFAMTQTWNRFLPDTLLVRQENTKVYWHLGGEDQLVWDFKEVAGYVWSISVPAFGSNKARTLIIRKEHLDTVPLYQHQYVRFSFLEEDCYWYERYKADEGTNLVYAVNVNPDTTEAFVLETRIINGGMETIDYDFPSLWIYLESLFGGNNKI